MGLFSWIILGLIAGFIGKWFISGNQHIGFVQTVFFGVMGALLGGFLGKALGIGTISGVGFKSILLASAGAGLVLWLREQMNRKTP